jgi:hypothetical protein
MDDVDPLLVCTLDLNAAAVCVVEATTQLAALLRTKSTNPSAQWRQDYADCRAYLLRAHQRYQAKMKEFAIEFARPSATELALPPSG